MFQKHLFSEHSTGDPAIIEIREFFLTARKSKAILERYGRISSFHL